MRKYFTLYLILIVTTFSAVVSRAATPDDAPFWTGQRDATTFTKLREDRLTKAKQSLDRMLAVTGKRTIENTLNPYDEMLTYVDAVANQVSLIKDIDLLDLRAGCSGVAQDQMWGTTDDLGVRPSDHNWMKVTLLLN